MAKIPVYKPPVEYKPEFNTFQDVKEFYPSFSEWLMKNGEIVYNSGEAFNGSTELYLVPPDKVFYLLTISMAYRNSAATTAANTFYLQSDAGSRDLLFMRTPNNAGSSAGLSLNFSPPLKLQSGNSIGVFSGDANTKTQGGFAGYAISKSKDFA